MQPKDQIDVRQFKKVFILYNRYSGRQLFASMMSRVNEVYKLLKQELDAEIELLDVQFFQHCLWKRLCFPPLNSLSTLVENHLTIHTKVCFWALCSVGLNVYPYVSITSF